MTKHKPYRGFTLVEVLIVIVVLALLATIIMISYNRQQQDSRDQKRRTDLAALRHELDNYYEKNGNYPLSCEHSVPAGSSCSSVTAGYTSAFGSTIPPTIGSGSDIAAIRAVLPGLKESFGDPLKKTDNPINQHVTSGSNYIKTSSYLLVSVDALNGGATSYLATNANASTYITCSYSPIQNDHQGVNRGNRPHPYILGYFSEVDKKWVFYQGPKLSSTNDLQWNYNSKPECDLTTT